MDRVHPVSVVGPLQAGSSPHVDRFLTPSRRPVMCRNSIGGYLAGFQHLDSSILRTSVVVQRLETVHRPLENSRILMFVHAALRATRDNQGTPGAIAGQERNRASLHRALGGYRFVTRRNAVSIDWDATCADTRSRPSGDNLPQNACSPKNRCRETSHKPPRDSFSKVKTHNTG